ncbi:MAG TPA: hypothetical protein VD902_06800 [Symbiobacteriaceae bacterium]|nr:hypothetical protein [Symbiobacteriaceae bacterium]
MLPLVSGRLHGRIRKKGDAFGDALKLMWRPWGDSGEAAERVKGDSWETFRKLVGGTRERPRNTRRPRPSPTKVKQSLGGKCKIMYENTANTISADPEDAGSPGEAHQEKDDKETGGVSKAFRVLLCRPLDNLQTPRTTLTNFTYYLLPV